MPFHQIVWTPKTNTERTALSKWPDWVTAKKQVIMSGGAYKGVFCIAIWPVNRGNDMRWIPVTQIVSIDGESYV